MLPVGSLSQDEAGRLSGVIFDVDDTVTRHGKLEAVAFESMWRLRAAGLQLVAVTGRPLGWAEFIARQWPVSLAIGENGAGWVWGTEKTWRRGYYADETARREHGELLATLVREVRSAFPEVALANDQGLRCCDVAFDIGEEHELAADQIQRLAEFIEAKGAKAVVSSVHAHAVFGDWDKAKGCRRALKEVLSVDLEGERNRWLFVGDSGNDAAAFAYFPLSVGVANVADHMDRLPVPPRYVTDADRGRGFCELADLLLRLRGCKTVLFS